MYSRAMLPKQIESVMDLLEQYDCSHITLRRGGPIRDRSGHLVPEYVLTCVREGIDLEWRDHTLTRLMATVATAVTRGAGDAPIVS